MSALPYPRYKCKVGSPLAEAGPLAVDPSPPLLSSSSWDSADKGVEDDEEDGNTSGFVSDTEQDNIHNPGSTPSSPKLSVASVPVNFGSVASTSSTEGETNGHTPIYAPPQPDQYISPPTRRRRSPMSETHRSLMSETCRSLPASPTSSQSETKPGSTGGASILSESAVVGSPTGRCRMDSSASSDSGSNIRKGGTLSRDFGSRVRKIAGRRSTVTGISPGEAGSTRQAGGETVNGSYSPESRRRQSKVTASQNARAASQRDRSSSELPHLNTKALDRIGSFYSRIQVFQVSFFLPVTKGTVKLSCPGNKTVGEIKEMLWDTLRENRLLLKHPSLADPDLYTLKYKKFGTDCELYDQEQLFQTLSIVAYWRSKQKGKPELRPELRVELKKPENEEARQFQVFINTLIGFDMEELIVKNNNDEADITRRKLISVRHAAVSSRDSELYAMEPALTHSEVPESIKKMCAVWIDINVQFEDQKDKQQQILFQVSETPLDLLQFLFNPDSGKRTLLGIPESAEAYQYTLKVCGMDSYLYSGEVFLKYTYIRRCLLKKTSICLAVVKKPDIKEDSVPNHGEPDFIDDCYNLTGSHQQLSSLTKVHSQVFTMSLWDIHTPYRVKVIGVDGLTEFGNSGLFYVEAGIYHGGRLVCPAKGTSSVVYAHGNILINEHFYFDVKVCNLPKAARMHIVIYALKKPLSRRGSVVTSGNSLSPTTSVTNTPGSGSPQTRRKWLSSRLQSLSPRLPRRSSSDPVGEMAAANFDGDAPEPMQDEQFSDPDRPLDLEPLYWINMQLLDHRAVLRTGNLQLSMWHVPLRPDGERDTSKFTPNSCTSENPDTSTTATLYLALDEFAHRVACPTAGLGEVKTSPDGLELKGESGEEVRSPSKKFLRDSLEAAISASDPLKPLTKLDKDLLWSCRDICKKRPEALPRFLLSLNWADKEHVLEMHKLLRGPSGWAPLTMEVALQLLDYHFADEDVRRLAVKRLEMVENDDLLTFLLQLVQTLKFEPYHDSALANFLLIRALQSKRIGHNFFWFLRAEMDTPEYRERFGLLLEAYLRGCGHHMLCVIHRQQQVNQFLMKVSSQVEREKLEHRAGIVKQLIRKSDVMKGDLRPVYDSSVVIGDLVIDKCKCMDSKKAPLWLEFSNKDPTAQSVAPVKVIFKQGDDLRQDMLTLQMIKLMDKLWQDNGLDLFMVPYGCMSTGNEVGFIQVVLEAETVASIQRKRGGDLLSNARASFTDDTLAIWLKEKQPSHKEHVQAVRRFVLSCAGYCVATYVLGIGDRHNDNIMITKSGNLFHIDFGHFLGNTKKFFGGLVNRERAPFVLTPDFVHIMGKKDSANFRSFLDTSCKAYNIIRQHAHLFINLFSMMKCTGIPELTCIEDLDYLRNVLLLDKTDEEASVHFVKQVDRCLDLAWTVRCNFIAHNANRRT